MAHVISIFQFDLANLEAEQKHLPLGSKSAGFCLCSLLPRIIGLVMHYVKTTMIVM